jgi:chromosome segregation protein
VQITRLKLLGFKSFVEPSDLLIEPGLTGVVGPNGCGKSNLLEAMRWVMGETSFKSMRGSAMDDVIFAGTDKRPARNAAEVTVYIDNSARTAPAAFNDSDVLEISRRIQREAGSVYKVNGKEARARDVQLLFADAATGARSRAMVQQGQIGEIVNAKPQDRRRVLEDAAGIAGLRGRRHEAEMRLKAAESNLERLQDVIGQIGSQLQSLRRQARQAQKYRELSAELRKAEAIQHHLLWTAAQRQVEGEEAALFEVTRAVGQFTQAEAHARSALTEAAEGVPHLREEETVRAAVLRRLEVERAALDQEEARARDREVELKGWLDQVERDIERENSAMAEALELLERLAEEEENLKAAENQDAAKAQAKAEAEEAAQALAEAENALALVTGEAADLRARRRQYEEQASGAARRAERLALQVSAIEDDLRALRERDGGGDLAETLSMDAERLAIEIENIETQTQAAEQRLAEARAKEKITRDQAASARLRARQLETEAATLVKLLKPAGDSRFRPVVEDVQVASGYEMALGAALGDDLDAPADREAPAHWAGASGEGDAPLPAGAEPLSRFVKAPGELGRRLAQVGVAARADGPRLMPLLAPGQRLVSAEGDLWRWDGFTSAADAPTPSAQRLAERNRLDGLQVHVEETLETADAAEEAREAAQAEAVAAQEEEKRLRELWRSTQAKARQNQDALSKAERAMQESASKLAAMEEALSRTKQQLAEAQEEEANSREDLAELPPLAEFDATLEERKAEVAELRAVAANARAALQGVEREMGLRQERVRAIASERGRWAQRSRSAETQMASLQKRFRELRGELDGLADLPAKVMERRQKLLDEIGQAETARRAAADALAAAENVQREQERAVRQAQASLGEAREQKARIEARLEAARERRGMHVKQIAEALECVPEDCLAVAGVEPGAELPSQIDVEQSIVKLKGERERLGGVNLQAEEEASELGKEFDGLETERADLEEAIAKLRQGISSLNKEGRRRLLEAFETVNGHFQRLFTVLFGGGEAELQLIESDDPLESGLEILARPPGKKPQVLTLLSGGEKALTAMSLIFAVFLTNPSPICVLDEVDAPLDDANVHRFTAMMEEMARTTSTRFLVITHHPMTMARMNRLFGVTMQEKGVSQLVSVDLQTAERFREAG